MTREEAFKLTPEISYVIFAKGKYRVAYIAEEFGATWIGIYDEPPSLHVDRIHASGCSFPPAEGAETISKITNSPIGGVHWYRSILSKIKDIGEFLSTETPKEEYLRVWGRELFEGSIELLKIENNPTLKQQPTAEKVAELKDSSGNEHHLSQLDKSRQPVIKTAEGAEEYLHSTPMGYIYRTNKGRGFEYKFDIDSVISLMNTFATLHAQKIADKMVEERLREELITYRRWENVFFMGMEDVTSMVDMYLKIGEK
jgi:hypothetical protein